MLSGQNNFTASLAYLQNVIPYSMGLN